MDTIRKRRCTEKGCGNNLEKEQFVRSPHRSRKMRNVKKPHGIQRFTSRLRICCRDEQATSCKLATQVLAPLKNQNAFTIYESLPAFPYASAPIAPICENFAPSESI